MIYSNSSTRAVEALRSLGLAERQYDRPPKRPLQIYASDPMAGRAFGNRARIEIDNEPLRPGPQGMRVEVIDYNGETGHYYGPVNLDDPNLLMQAGLDPNESDPRFHQQMVYAVAMRTLENFDRALGRTVYLQRRFSGTSNQPQTNYPRLRLFPHAFYGANAYYDASLNAILFGYFKADARDAGPNLPGQTVFTCLSHDIVAHEMVHAIVDRLKPHFLEPSNRDVLAFHEGFADIVALFQHFSFTDVLREQIQLSRTSIHNRGRLVDLAQQFGYALGTGRSLRSALEEENPDPNSYERVMEPHERGSILVAAVFDAFFNVYQRRIRDLIRIATGGSGRLPEGDLHPDLVGRVAVEAARTAQTTLNMCIRAFDYLPPVDITFGDYLRALVTADYELNPEDEFGQRGAMIEGFRRRGIYPEGVYSLAEESLLWDTAPAIGAKDALPPLPLQTQEMLKELMFAASSLSRDFYYRTNIEQAMQHADQMSWSVDPEEERERDVSETMSQTLQSYAEQFRHALHLSGEQRIAVRGFHPVFRVAPNGKLLVELVVQYVQTDRNSEGAYGGIPLRGGTTLIASATGEVRYVIAKPLRSTGLSRNDTAAADARERRQRDYFEQADLTDARMAYYSRQEFDQRMKLRMRLASLHQGIRT